MLLIHHGVCEPMNADNFIPGLFMKGKYLFALFALLFLADDALSQVYKYIDKNGNVIYSDTPPEEQKDLAPAELPDLIIQPAVKVAPRAPETSSQTDATEIETSIIQPANESTITPGQMSFTVAAEVTRPLARGETAVLLVNGEEFGRSSNSLSWTIDNLIRGEMRLQVRIINRENALLAESETLRVFVQRPSVNR